jgi:hypothetical protein
VAPRRRPRHAPEVGAPVLYFAFGANMASEVLVARRGLRPVWSAAAALPGHRLVFDLPGLPFVEPSFASVAPDPEARVHGVVWALSPSDLRRLDGFESGRYRRTPLPVEILGRGPAHAEVYVNRRPARARPPSRRYLDLLARGAEEHGLPADYVAWLRAHPAGDLSVLRPLGFALLAQLHRLRGGA